MKKEDSDRRRDDLAAGVDAGSTTTKAVLLDRDRKIASFAILPTGPDSRDASRLALSRALEEIGAGQSSLAFVVATGYGREIASEAKGTVTEITCHARGVHALMDPIRTIIDIGGQDSKAIRINGQGRVQDFAMNDKCAAGTGRFLEVMSRGLGVPLQAMGERAQQATKDVRVSSMCTVFAESEVVSLVAKGEKVEDILNGIHQAIADRVASLALRVGLETPVAVTGGVAMNSGVVRALEARLATPIAVPEDPQLTGALGAAMIAWDKLEDADG
jgi:(R)-2-hydroxyacyl-CoA dehydratese activating ATPase